MSGKPPPSDLPIHAFRTVDDFEKFLDRAHSSSPGIWLKLAKKSSGITSVTFAEATEVALCFGWINGQGAPFDDHWSLSRFVPRRPKSTWSKKNVETVARLVESGRMRRAGIVAAEAAKADGRWERAYDGPAAMVVPEDFASALAEDPAASEVFGGLKKMGRYGVLLRVHTASPQNRKKLIERLIKGLADGKVPGKPASAVKPDDRAEPRGRTVRPTATRGPKGRKQAEKARPLEDDKSQVTTTDRTTVSIISESAMT